MKSYHFRKIVRPHYTVEKWKIYSHQYIFPSNQLFSDLFSKCVVFTKFLPKSVRVVTSSLKFFVKLTDIFRFFVVQRFRFKNLTHVRTWVKFLSNWRKNICKTLLSWLILTKSLISRKFHKSSYIHLACSFLCRVSIFSMKISSNHLFISSAHYHQFYRNNSIMCETQKPAK